LGGSLIHVQRLPFPPALIGHPNALCKRMRSFNRSRLSRTFLAGQTEDRLQRVFPFSRHRVLSAARPRRTSGNSLESCAPLSWVVYFWAYPVYTTMSKWRQIIFIASGIQVVPGVCPISPRYAAIFAVFGCLTPSFPVFPPVFTVWHALCFVRTQQRLRPPMEKPAPCNSQPSTCTQRCLLPQRADGDIGQAPENATVYDLKPFRHSRG
jgi:hypothetical protein